jgi:hypothetical protein
MQVSVDGMRSALMAELKDLKAEIESSHAQEELSDDGLYEIANKFDAIAQTINIFMLVHQEDNESDFNEMKDHRCDYFDLDA